MTLMILAQSLPLDAEAIRAGASFFMFCFTAVPLTLIVLFIRALIKRRWKLFLGVFLPVVCLAGLLTLGYFRAKAALREFDARRVEEQLTTGFKNSGLYATKEDDGRMCDIPYELEVKDHVGKVTFHYPNGSKVYYKADIRMENGNVRTTFSGGDGYKWSLVLTPAQWQAALPKLPWYVIRGSGTFEQDGSGTASATSPGDAAQLAADLQRQREIDANNFVKEAQAKIERWNLAQPDPTPEEPNPKPLVTSELPAATPMPTLDAKGYFDSGKASYKKKLYENAISDFSNAIQLDPNYAAAYNERGIAYYDQGKFDKAISDYNEAIRLDPNNAGAYNNRGDVYDDQGKFDEAIRDYNKAIRLNPNDADAYDNRGIAYWKQRKFDKAIIDYNKAIRLDPNDANAYNHRGIAYRDQGKFDKANDDFATARQLKGG
jgi:tetratricopeptide (TPR) repeat protein